MSLIDISKKQMEKQCVISEDVNFKINELQTQLSESFDERDELKTQLSETEDERDELKRQVDELKDEITSLNNHITDLEIRANDLEEELTYYYSPSKEFLEELIHDRYMTITKTYNTLEQVLDKAEYILRYEDV